MRHALPYGVRAILNCLIGLFVLGQATSSQAQTSAAASPPTAVRAEPPWWARGWSTPTMVQYGVGFDGEFVIAPGDICPKTEPCILGSGGGITANIGLLYGRSSYAGIAYSLTKQNPSRLYRFATLQEGRLEIRRYLESERDTRLFGAIGTGLAGYGEEWGVDTYGPLIMAAVGAEVELSAKTVAVASLGYRAVRFSSFRDSAGTERNWGVSHFMSLEVALEARSDL
jgi:hypothetical protein